MTTVGNQCVDDSPITYRGIEVSIPLVLALPMDFVCVAVMRPRRSKVAANMCCGDVQITDASKSQGCDVEANSAFKSCVESVLL